MSVQYYLPEYEDLWIETGYDPLAFFHRLYNMGRIEKVTYETEVMDYGGTPVTFTQIPPDATTDFDPAPESRYLPQYTAEWEAAGRDPEKFFQVLRRIGAIDADDHEQLAAAKGWDTTPIEVLAGQPLDVYKAEISAALRAKQQSVLGEYFRELLKSLWTYYKEQLRAIIELIVNSLKPIIEAAWEFCRAKIEEVGRSAYDGAMKMFSEAGPLTPEKAPELALKLYLFAMAMGMGAHGVATGTELLHPLKRVGLHQTAAAIGDYASFGRISGATIGPLYTRVLQQAMTYAVQKRYRPRIPFENLLIELRSKREIDKAQFDEAMAYQGFDKNWIDVIERWQWKDPRMFEILRIADVGLDQGKAPAEEAEWFRKYGVTGDRMKDWWLWRKFMRAGYEDVDIPVMVRLVHRREVAFAMTYVRTAIRRNYRWGYLTDEEMDKWMDRLSLPEQAKEWIRWAGELDRDYFYKQDLVAYYKTAYKNDVISDRELLVSLVSMSMPAREAEIIVRTEKVKKKPKAVQPVAPEAEEVTGEYQKEYITLYTQQYRKDLIGEDMFRAALISLGITEELADVTVAIEAARKGVTI